jgi:hypothetical protein
MSQPKRDRSPQGQLATNEVSPKQPDPRVTAASAPVVWSAAHLSRILQDDGNDEDKKVNFLSPTITSCLRVEGVGPDPEPFFLPIRIDTVLQTIAVWWPSPAAALWNGTQCGEGGRADALRAMIRIDSIVGGMWDLAPVVVHVGPAHATPWAPRRVSQWAVNFAAQRL